ncbi:MAG: radical SAM protein [Pirellulales bacterium]
MQALRDHTFLGMTQSLCPECLAVVPAKIIVRGQRVYFRKHCPTHGSRDDFICSDVAWFDRLEYSLPGRVPERFGTLPERGCPLDCGLCTEHEQHTCVGLIELTSSCNLSCPMCYASSGPGGEHLPLEQIFRAIDRLVAVEGRAEVAQLSGGEPTIHPQFEQVLDYACAQAIDIVMINTNGVRLAHDAALLDFLAERRRRIEIYFQFDGFDAEGCRRLRGENLVDLKLRALAELGRRDIRCTLVATLQPGVNDHEMGALVRFGAERPWITGISFQPATYSGRHVLPEELERRITFPDVIRGVAAQTDGMFAESDFMPLPCAHPNCHSLAYAYRARGTLTPLTRFIDAREHLELLANGITFTRPRARDLIQEYLGSLSCCGGDCGCGPTAGREQQLPVEQPASRAGLPVVELGAVQPAGESIADEFFRRALAEDLAPEDVFRITITSFLDVYNFDVRRVMKCCTHHVLPSGHVIPFCAYNVLYRSGHVALPKLVDQLSREAMEIPAGTSDDADSPSPLVGEGASDVASSLAGEGAHEVPLTSRSGAAAGLSSSANRDSNGTRHNVELRVLGSAESP